MGKVVLLHAPLFRLCGSHNDRAPLTLCYLSAHLAKAGVDHVVYNADFTGAEVYWKWSRLFDNFKLFEAAVDGVSPVYYEVAEKVMSYDPEAVVVSAGDLLLASVCLGNPFAALEMARVLKEAGWMKVYGYGHYVTLDTERWLWTSAYDGLILGGPSGGIVRAAGFTGVFDIGKPDASVAPEFSFLEPAGQKCDVVMTSFGCGWRCKFCLMPRLLSKVMDVPWSVVVSDIKGRGSDKLFLGDMVFPLRAERLRELATAFEAAGVRKRRFVCESRCDTIDEERCELMKELGVVAVKLGIESCDDGVLAAMNKRSSLADVERAVGLLKEFDLGIIAYVMLGGPGCTDESVRKTYEWLVENDPGYVVVSIWADDMVGDLAQDYRYDTHFSPRALERWGISKEWFYKLLELQKNRSVSKLSHVIG